MHSHLVVLLVLIPAKLAVLAKLLLPVVLAKLLRPVVLAKLAVLAKLLLPVVLAKLLLPVVLADSLLVLVELFRPLCRRHRPSMIPSSTEADLSESHESGRPLAVSAASQG